MAGPWLELIALQEQVEKTEKIALGRYENARRIAERNDYSLELTICIRRAILWLSNGSGTRNAYNALTDSTHALELCITLCKRDGDMEARQACAEIDDGLIHTRDTLSIRIQIFVLQSASYMRIKGDCNAYKAHLTELYGGEISDKEWSRCMQSYSKTIALKFPCIAFQTNIRRVKRQKDQKRAKKEPPRKHTLQYPPLLPIPQVKLQNSIDVDCPRPPPGLSVQSEFNKSEPLYVFSSVNVFLGQKF